MRDYDSIVARGAQLLDSDPDVPKNWRELIDIERLDLATDNDCVLGQLSEGWAYAPSHLKFEDAFYVYAGDINGMEEAWKRYLRPEPIDS